MTIDYEMSRMLRFMGMTLETNACINCNHFRQHYCKDGTLIFCGHCCYPRMKPRNLNDTCGYFENKNAPSGAADA